MTRPQFVAALRDAGFAVDRGLIVDASGTRCDLSWIRPLMDTRSAAERVSKRISRRLVVDQGKRTRADDPRMHCRAG